MVTIIINYMTDEKKTTNNKEEKAEDKPKTDTTKKTQDASAQPQDEESKSTDTESAQDDAPIEVKKGKSQYATIKKEDIRPGMLVRVHQKIVDTNSKGEEKERVQVFQGMVLARKHGRENSATITVRKVSEGIGVEKIFPLNMPSIEKIELVRTYRIKQAKPYYLRTTKKRLAEIKE